MPMRPNAPIPAILLVALPLAGCQSGTNRPAFTQEEVAQMQELLRSREFTPGAVTLIRMEAGRTDSRNYRFVLPVFGPPENGRQAIVGSQTIGKLPVTEVRRLASARKLEYNENSNAQAIIFQNAEQGGAPGGGSGGGGKGGCESDHSTPAHG